MLTLPDKEVSYWIESDGHSNRSVYPELKSDITVDVAIVGGGIAGLSTAYFLKRAGLTVAVLEKNEVGHGVTGHTTGKVTSQHNLCYVKLQRKFGKEEARLYGEANQVAIDRMERIITEEKIDCDWRREDNYIFTDKPEEVDGLKTEALVATDLGLPAEFRAETPLPFPVEGAVRFGNQATFHSLKYVSGLAAAVNGGGSFIFEHSPATQVTHGSPGIVTAKNGRVTAKNVVIATNVPFPLLTHIAYGLLEYPLKSYIIASRVKDVFPGMYITPGGPLRSILPVKVGEANLLLVGGGSHLPGLGSGEKRYRELADYAERELGLTSIDYKWSAWDYLGYDDKPLVGKLFPWTETTYVATGFLKWGLTNGTVAGMILADAILGNKNAWAPAFTSNRLSPITSIPTATVQIAKLAFEH